MRRVLFGLITLLPMIAAADNWRPGVHYQELSPSAANQHTQPNKIEVVEFFWYSCSHCDAFEPELADWARKRSHEVELVRVPVLWREPHRSDARLFYTLQVLGRTDLHSAVFDAIFRERKRLFVQGNEVATMQSQLSFAQSHGIDVESFRKARDSASVSTALARAERLSEAFHVGSVPSRVVNGRYVSNRGRVGGSTSALLTLTDALVDRELSARRSAAVKLQ
jgi:protein dithiol oxidoreductase (disulfide-forming)